MQPCLIRLSVAALAVAGFLTLSPRASADTIGSITLTLDPSLPANGNGVNGGGAFTWNQTAPINGASVTTYCVDINDSIRSGTFTTHTDITAVPNISSSDATAIKTLYDHYYSSSFASAITEAAFQYALWKLVYGSSYTIPTGSTPDQKTAAIEANYLLNGEMYNGKAYDNKEHDLANASLVALVPCDNGVNGLKPNQAQLMVVPNPPKGVPAPPAVMLAGIGMLALFGRARWNRKATPTV